MKAIIASLSLAALALLTPEVRAHCQIPCGIYDDDTVFAQLMTDVETIQKSVSTIEELAGKETAPDKNQLTRWTVNKEHHADHIMERMLNYFLAQRIKAEHENYADQLAASHSVITLAMKSKQTVDAAVVSQLKAALTKFKELYSANA